MGFWKKKLNNNVTNIKPKKEIALGTIRIKTKDLKAYEKTKTGWKKSKQSFPQTLQVIKLFKANNSFKVLIDNKNSEFLKGQLSPEGLAQGARISILPNNEKIDKAYSLFAKNLRIHDQDSQDHWDVLYQNKGGTWSYCYTLEKKKLHKNRKFKKVWQFDKVYDKLLKNVEKGISKKEEEALPLYTLLKTHMRVGNEIYFKAHGHKGLTTLKKKDIKIKGKTIIFNYLAKDGVPRHIEQQFPNNYVKILSKKLKSLKDTDFVFHKVNSNHPLPEQHFKKYFKLYCGEEFFPHIVRSHYASKEVKEFLKKNKKATKEEVNTLFLSIAAELGHKKFLKKENKWQDNYSVTVNHYIQPELVQRVRSIIK